MQKNFLIRRSGKGTAAVIGCAALLLLLCASEVLRNGDNTVFDVLSDSRESMYKQLDTRSDPSEKAVETTQKMNFDFEDNANFSVLSPSLSDNALSVSASEIPEIREIAVYDTRAGQVRLLPLEEYVVGALVAEMPQSFEKQALMAQAVACRTFAVRAAMRHDKHKNAAVCTDYRCCQSFRDAAEVEFDISAAREAVEATRGIIAVYDGEPILAAYHAASVGYTRSSAEVWGGELAYLVPVAAVESRESAAEVKAVSAKALTSALRAVALKKNKAAFEGGRICCYADADGLCTGISDGVTVCSPQEVQNALGLRSDTFSVSENDKEYVFTSYGFGHGVGMSQYGANALAEEGYDFYEILKYYYTGIGFAFCS